MTTRGRPVLTPLPPRDKGITTKTISGLESRRDSNDDENQVVPFSADGDDGDEPHSNAKHSNNNRRPIFEKRPSPGSTEDSAKDGRQLGKPENAWDEASRGSAYSSDDDSDEDESDEEDTYKSRRASERPESPSRRRHLSQQSDEEDSTDESNGETVKESAPPVPAPTPAGAASSVDLSRLSKLAVFPGTETHLVQGHILRVKTMLSSQYHYFINGQLLLMAEKQMKNRTSNYHLFDMTRSVALSSKLSKKSGNYIGKLRSNFSKKKCVLVGNFSRKTELGAMVFGSSFNSSEPRRLTTILPPLSRRQEIEGLTVGDSSSSFSMLIDLHRSLTDADMAVAHSALAPESLQIFENKEPVFENGFYRLNFNGRVSVPSVKNFQLVRAGPGDVPNNERPIFLQFGKVDDKKFHLDFRAPITPIQAFATALAQFNL
ncbi:Tubby-related protein 2 [Phytophthora cinnamomi]|uniref:Tubby-related protein 2 n=1 Tax=Phytophthora cinnamomi TaxID=4785 RepID=UPI003559F6FA|nr:Tubby-related protein 2 [Phytophthora cinnamomi]